MRRCPSRATSKEYAAGYRRAYAFTAPSCGLRYVPEERQRSLRDPGDVLAPRGVAQEEAGRRIHHVLERRAIETTDHSLLVIKTFGFEPVRDFLFHVRTCR